MTRSSVAAVTIMLACAALVLSAKIVPAVSVYQTLLDLHLMKPSYDDDYALKNASNDVMVRKLN